MRKLARIETITNVQPIEGADLIDHYWLTNWKVVDGKNLYSVGEKVIYCEIDSYLPIRPEFEFLRKSSYRKQLDQEGFRLKTIKLKGVISQGLILPLSLLPPGDYEDGDEVTELLGITKFEPILPANIVGQIKGNFPSFVAKTSEERIQNLKPDWETWVEKLSSQGYYATEKLHGTSFTAFLNLEEYGVCSRNMNLKDSEGNALWQVAKELNLETKLRELDRNLAIQGELIGPGINGNSYKLPKPALYVFTIFDIDNFKKVPFLEFQKIVSVLGLTTVPLLDLGSLPDSIEGMLSLADGQSQLNPKTIREGLVIRTLDNATSFKVISNRFLLKEKE